MLLAMVRRLTLCSMYSQKKADKSQNPKDYKPCKSHLRIRLCIQGFWTPSANSAGSGPSIHHETTTALGNFTSNWSLDIHPPETSGCCFTHPIVQDHHKSSSVCAILLGWRASRVGVGCDDYDVCAMYAESAALESNNSRQMLELKCQSRHGLCSWGSVSSRARLAFLLT